MQCLYKERRRYRISNLIRIISVVPTITCAPITPSNHATSAKAARTVTLQVRDLAEEVHSWEEYLIMSINQSVVMYLPLFISFLWYWDNHLLLPRRRHIFQGWMFNLRSIACYRPRHHINLTLYGSARVRLLMMSCWEPRAWSVLPLTWNSLAPSSAYATTSRLRWGAMLHQHGSSVVLSCCLEEVNMTAIGGILILVAYYESRLRQISI